MFPFRTAADLLTRGLELHRTRPWNEICKVARCGTNFKTKFFYKEIGVLKSPSFTICTRTSCFTNLNSGPVFIKLGLDEREEHRAPNMAHIRQSRLDSGLGVQVNVHIIFKVFPRLLHLLLLYHSRA